METPELKEWLLASTPWAAYRTRIDILGQNLEDKDVKDNYRVLISHPMIKKLIAELKYWPGKVLKRHNDADLLIHKLVFLADIGLSNEHKEIRQIAEIILDTYREDGPFQIISNIPVVFGGSGQDESLWMLCDAPLVTYALIKFGYGNHPAVIESVDYLAGLVRDNGWPCAASTKLCGKFKGPGGRKWPCPYANLLMIRVLGLTGTHFEELSTGIETQLWLWSVRKEKRPFLFAMGTDFKKLKAPLIWYDILHVLTALSPHKHIHKDQRFMDMLDILKAKFLISPQLRPESVWRAWKEWDFGQKREASSWISYLAMNILNQTGLDFK